jgi:hypothetical protein
MQLSPNLLFFIAFTVVDEINDEDTKTEEQTTVTKETEEEKLLDFQLNPLVTTGRLRILHKIVTNQI